MRESTSYTAGTYLSPLALAQFSVSKDRRVRDPSFNTRPSPYFSGILSEFRPFKSTDPLNQRTPSLNCRRRRPFGAITPGGSQPIPSSPRGRTASFRPVFNTALHAYNTYAPRGTISQSTLHIQAKQSQARPSQVNSSRAKPG